MAAEAAGAGCRTADEVVVVPVLLRWLGLPLEVLEARQAVAGPAGVPPAAWKNRNGKVAP